MDDIQDLTNDELSAKLKSLGLKSGPILAGTRRVYENVLRNYFRDKNQDFGQGSDVPEEDETNEVVSDVESCTMVEESNDSTRADSKMFYGVWVENKEKEFDDQGENEWVFSCSKDAIRAMKNVQGARMKGFKTKDEAINFSKSRSTSNTDSVNKISEPTTPFRSPTPQQLVIFREEIKKGNLKSVEEFIKGNPKYLVSSFETPVILHEGSRYNAMHIAAIANKVEICKLVIDTLEDPGFWCSMFGDECNPYANECRSRRLLDYYVNSPDKGGQETPLHIACKFGFTEVVKFLVSLPYLEKGRENRWGETAEQVICSRCSEYDKKKQSVIADLLSANCYYITLLRADDESEVPILCSPVTKNSDPIKSYRSEANASSPIDPKFQVKACAGPMSPEQAQDFFKEWKSPRRRNVLKDFEKGKESVGRKLANQYGIPWKEHWSFLECFTDLSTRSGLQKLENFFRRKIEPRKAVSDSSSNKQTKKSDNSKVPQQFNDKFKMISPGIAPKTQEPDSVAKNLFEDFNRLGEGANDVGTGKEPLGNNLLISSSNVDVEGLSKSLERISLDEKTSPTRETRYVTSDSITTEIRNERVHTPIDSNDRISTNSISDCDVSVSGTSSYEQNSTTVFEESYGDVNVTEGKYLHTQPRNSIPKTYKQLFISGNFPSKLDIDVYEVIKETEFGINEYPLIHQWKQNICRYSNEEKRSWPSPCSPRYRSRLPKQSSMES